MRASHDAAAPGTPGLARRQAASRTAARLAALLIVAGVGLGAAAPADAPADTPRSARNANYTIDATLDPSAHTLSGHARITWRNPTRRPVSELRFHLYWNAWRNDASSWLREARLAGATGFDGRTVGESAWIDLNRLEVVRPAGRVDLLPRLSLIAPDDGNAEDRTVAAVPLDRPVPPGGTVEVEVAWTAQVPRTYARTGVLSNNYVIAQWFPKIGMLAPDGWHAHQFHYTTEFFADFGSYDVRLTVPRNWIVAATGREQSVTSNADGTDTHRYVADDVHDFAWATDPNYVEAHDRFEEEGLPPVDIRLLLQPEHAGQRDRYFASARAALSAFGQWFGPYPYDHLTIVDPVTAVDPAVQGGDTGGMEYPTLITGGTYWNARRAEYFPEAVVVHEIAHQFFYGIVATDEFEHAWMDEGLATYAEARVIDDRFPGRFVTVERYFGGLVAWPFDDVRWERVVEGDRLRVYRRGPDSNVPAAPSWAYWPATAFVTTYDRSALWLDTLERLLGWETMQRVLSTYFDRWKFRHPGPEDFFATASEVSQRDLGWFFDAVYRRADAFDYGVGTVASTPRPDGTYDSVVQVRRLQAGVFPVTVQVAFEDGSEAIETWDGADPWHAFTYRRPSRVSAVRVDPDRVLLLDLHRTNNTWTARPAARSASTALGLRWLTWMEELLLTYASFI